MTKCLEVFNKNIDRVNGLILLYKKVKSEKIGDTTRYKITDILRSAVVLCHSTFENYLRDIICNYYLKCTDKTGLEKIVFYN